MSEWLEVDGAAQPPAWAQDGTEGDRVRLLERGVLLVERGRASFARYTDILAIAEHGGDVFLMVPRRPPAPPWLRFAASDRFAERVRDRLNSGGGYRDAVQRSRQGLSPKMLLERARARTDVPGALEVPSTALLGVSYPGLAPTQAGVVGTLAYGGATATAIAGEILAHGAATVAVYPGLLVGGTAGVLLALYIGKVWRARRNRTVPRQRVLVLAPDGCVVGFTAGVQALAWSEVGRFTRGWTPEHEPALVVLDREGRELGALGADWLDAPLDLVITVAEAYRDAAGDS